MDEARNEVSVDIAGHSDFLPRPSSNAISSFLAEYSRKALLRLYGQAFRQGCNSRYGGRQSDRRCVDYRDVVGPPV